MNHRSRSRLARSLPWFSAFALALPLAAQDAPKHLLRMAFEPGRIDWYRQTIAMDQLMNMGTGGKPMESKTQTTTTMTSEVKGIDGGMATLCRKFEGMKVHSTGMLNVDYDSDDPDSRPGPLAPLADMVGETITMTMDERARVSEVKTSPDFPTQAISMFGGDLKQFVAQCIPEMPELPVAVGESWPNEIEITMQQMGKLKMKVVNTLAEVNGKVARIDQKIEVDTSGLGLPPGAAMKADKVEGAVTFDLATGMPIEWHNTMTLEMQGGANVAMTMRMESRIQHIDAPAQKPKAKDAAGKTDGGK